MIDYAEALTVIDVNSGSFVGRGKQARLEDTILKTNLEAAEEVVNELRLRDIGGIIVIDFIDMARARNRDAVMKALRTSLDEDRTKTFTAEISKLGLVEMTRQNVTEGVREIISRPCPTCDGEGVIRSEETIAIDFERRMRDLGNEAPEDVEAFLVQMNPRVSAQFTGNGARVLHALEEGTGSPSTSRAPRACPSTTSRSRWRARATRSRSARCRSARATRCSCTSSSRTCTTSTTRSPRSTATSSPSPARGRSWGRSASCASSRPGARPRPPSSSTRRAPQGSPGWRKDSDDGQTRGPAARAPRRAAALTRHGRRRGAAGVLGGSRWRHCDPASSGNRCRTSPRHGRITRSEINQLPSTLSRTS